MRVRTECSCGANLAVSYTETERRSTAYAPDKAEARAEKLLGEFRRDHKNCRAANTIKTMRARPAEGAVT